METTITIPLAEYNNLKKAKEEHELLKPQVTETINTIAALKEQVRLLKSAKSNETNYTQHQQKSAYY